MRDDIRTFKIRTEIGMGRLMFTIEGSNGERVTLPMSEARLLGQQLITTADDIDNKADRDVLQAVSMGVQEVSEQLVNVLQVLQDRRLDHTP